AHRSRPLRSGASRTRDWTGIAVKLAIVLALAVLVTLSWDSVSLARMLPRLHRASPGNSSGPTSVAGLWHLLWEVLEALALLRAVLWLRYRPVAPREDLPWLSVVVPAFNEGPMVARSLESILVADYPAGQL